MSTLQKYIDRAMSLNCVDVAQYPASVALEDANIVIHQIEDYITSAIGEGFFWDILSINTTVVSQSEYNIPTIASGSFDSLPKIESVSIQYTAGGDFLPARLVNRQTLLQTHDLTWYEVNQSKEDPIFFITDSSVFLYPYPDEAVVGGLKMYGIKSLVDITASTDETSIFGGKIPTKYMYMISEGMTQFILKRQNKMQEAEVAKNIFEREILTSLVDKLGNRKVGISMRDQGDYSIYK